ncbi:hypothetical protein K0M31_018962 [Melipona bicolor]|uniref:Secreted protein n=1 Tax=Melipona bicolor TaxID=60889 RepID=A0AA40FCK3_9HYME|nr:hypothetical protein K0M31_018962 [Melipona bicolor]
MSIFRLLYGLLPWAMARAISTSWNPSFTPATFLHQGPAAQSLYDVGGSLLLAQQQQHHHQDQCALYKVAMNQQLYFEVRE